MAEDEKAAAAPAVKQAAAATEPAPPSSSPPAPPPTVADEPGKAPKTFGVPLDSFVKFGTTTMKHDEAVAAQLAESRRRRAADDEEKRVAKERGLQSGNPNEVASRYSNQFTDNPEIARAYVPLTYVTRTGREVTHEGRADVIMVQDPAFPNELALVLFCPMCIEKFHLPPDQSIIMVRQSNRSWHLDQRTAGELVADEHGAYRSAGTVVDGERFTCGRCSWAARIDKNKVWPD